MDDRYDEARYESAELRLDRPAFGAFWRRPSRVEAAEGAVTWSAAGRLIARPTRPMMLRFIGLQHRTDEQIAAYVRRWGALGLETSAAGFWATSGPLEPVRRSVASLPASSEPLAVYRREAKRISALMDCAAELYQGRVAVADRWAAFRIPQRFMDAVPVPRPGSLAMAQRVLAWQASQLQRDYGAVPVVEPVLRDGRSFRVVVAGARGGLAGALAYQVLVALARGEPFGWCDIMGCESAGVRRAHGRWYCETHDTDAAKNANRQRRYRMRGGRGGRIDSLIDSLGDE